MSAGGAKKDFRLVSSDEFVNMSKNPYFRKAIKDPLMFTRSWVIVNEGGFDWSSGVGKANMPLWVRLVIVSVVVVTVVPVQFAYMVLRVWAPLWGIYLLAPANQAQWWGSGYMAALSLALVYLAWVWMVRMNEFGEDASLDPLIHDRTFLLGIGSPLYRGSGDLKYGVLQGPTKAREIEKMLMRVSGACAGWLFVLAQPSGLDVWKEAEVLVFAVIAFWNTVSLEVLGNVVALPNNPFHSGVEFWVSELLRVVLAVSIVPGIMKAANDSGFKSIWRMEGNVIEVASFMKSLGMTGRKDTMFGLRGVRVVECGEPAHYFWRDKVSYSPEEIYSLADEARAVVEEKSSITDEVAPAAAGAG